MQPLSYLASNKPTVAVSEEWGKHKRAMKSTSDGIEPDYLRKYT